ncbi:hypothetical protein FRC0265_01944 [Corynebacterium diphtheriae]|nr:hypothetical protein FRC0265_01944 [Corynebacterium diphtheriae]
MAVILDPASNSQALSPPLKEKAQKAAPKPQSKGSEESATKTIKGSSATFLALITGFFSLAWS